jgi:hypothetical protein
MSGSIYQVATLMPLKAFCRVRVSLLIIVVCELARV